MYLKRINGDIIGQGASIIEIVEANKSDLTRVNLRGASLRWADLTGANLTGADLTGADLRWVDLTMANLTEARRNGYEIKTTPIILTGLRYDILIFDHHMEIGCEHHSFDEWSNFTDREILDMAGKNALEFWNDNKFLLLAYCSQKEKK